MNGNSDSENRINELIAELGSCRDDERSSHNQILQAIVTAGTILGILLGASYFSQPGQTDNIRVTFWLSISVFCAAFTYIVTLGIENVLRYYYIQELEDRLYILISKGRDDEILKSDFIHWGSFSGPIITRNPHHITSAYAALHFFNYSIAAICAVVFSMGLVFFQYTRIKEKTSFEIIGITGTFILMIIILGLFLVISILAKKMVYFTRKTAQYNLTCRINHFRKKMYSGTKEFYRMLVYFLYPKLKDLPKPVLILLGYAGGLIFTYERTGLQRDIWNYVSDLLYVLFCFDILAYQARFQINDIRGVVEKNSRLRDTSGRIVPEYIQLSLAIAAVKLVLATVMALWGNVYVRLPLVGSLIVLLIITVLYEVARTKQFQGTIYFLVGSGYPLRFFLGLFAAVPQQYWAEILHTPQFVPGVAAFWAYGASSSILAWANEVVEIMRSGKNLADHPKHHYRSLETALDSRFQSAIKHKIGKKFFPLRECGKLGDIWEIYNVAALSLLLLTTAFTAVPKSSKVIDIVAIVCFIIMIPSEYKSIRTLFCLGSVFMLSNVPLVSHGLKYSLCYAFMYLIQFMFAATYFILRYTPQFAPLQLKDLARACLKSIIGKDAFAVFSQKEASEGKKENVEQKEYMPK